MWLLTRLCLFSPIFCLAALWIMQSRIKKKGWHEIGYICAVFLSFFFVGPISFLPLVWIDIDAHVAENGLSSAMMHWDLVMTPLIVAPMVILVLPGWIFCFIAGRPDKKKRYF